MFEAWMVYKFLKSKDRKFFNLVTSLCIGGMALGVAALMVTMAVISGFEETLHRAVIDLTGHMVIIKRGEPLPNLEKFEPQIRALEPSVEKMAPFIQVEAMMAAHGKISGIVVNGFDTPDLKTVLQLDSRLTKGELRLDKNDSDEESPIVLGRALAEKLNVQVGEIISLVVPKNNATESGGLGFTPKLKKFKTVGIVDLGMYEYDSRFAITSASASRELAGMGPVYTGVRVKFKDPEDAILANQNLRRELGLQYFIKDWTEVSPNLFQAIKTERKVIFVVLLFMTVAACFNISSNLFVSVLRRQVDISTLRVLGATNSQLMKLFAYQGLVIGLLGSVLGVLLGWGGGTLISKMNLIKIPYEIYHIKSLPVSYHLFDLGCILFASILICWISTVGPARKAKDFNLVEGLRRE